MYAILNIKFPPGWSIMNEKTSNILILIIKLDKFKVILLRPEIFK